MLLGTYELELADLIESACALAFDTIVDIGAAQGYYAVGMAKRNATSRVIAFEDNTRLHRTLRSHAQANGVTNLQVRGRCDVGSLQAVLSERPSAFVICDIDGGESALLDPVVVPGLVGATLLVETHDVIFPGVTELLVARFTETHRVTVVPQRERKVRDVPVAVALPDAVALAGMDEGRGCVQSWLSMTPKTRS